ncbi:hypothetical protein DBB34_14560 [Sphaerisporangium cinnabarinum]|nr:helix-turn-helix domain-containing protein [Sphaerisporangium cinnabarinum]PTU55375.1 hypothetical protein DBB34_14560 [Sphaerisporangium cinnabarinum]
MSARAPLLGAHVRGAATLWILRRIERDVNDAIRHYRLNNRPDVAEQIADAAAQLRAVAAAWKSAETAASPRGSAELPPLVDPEESDTPDAGVLLGTAAVAEFLDVTPRRVRQLLDDGSLVGQKKAGRWLVTRRSAIAWYTRQEIER